MKKIMIKVVMKNMKNPKENQQINHILNLKRTEAI